MRSFALPRTLHTIVVPPIKCQGIKTKLVAFIASNICWEGKGYWIEPFLGSGAVLFNICPQRAIVCDINPHIIAFYTALQKGEIHAGVVHDYLVESGTLLQKYGADYYYFVRNRFNSAPNPLDFLFLNRAGFNGLMRFNQSGEFNTPFCKKTDRFRRAYITKIVNQVRQTQTLIQAHDWKFRVADYRECLDFAQQSDFVYLDPPYIGRHTGYFGEWTERHALELAQRIRELPCGYALSMWKSNRYRSNLYLQLYREQTVERVVSHFYHVGATEAMRNAVEEVLLIRKGYEACPVPPDLRPLQVALPLSEPTVHSPCPLGSELP